MKTIKEILSALKKGLIWAKDNPLKLTSGAFRVVQALILLVAIHLVYKACNSEIDGSVSLIQRDEKAGTFKLGTVSIEKRPPPAPKVTPSLHSLSFQYSTRHDKTLMYGRHITKWGKIDIWGNIGVTTDREGSLGAYVGITVLF